MIYVLIGAVVITVLNALGAYRVAKRSAIDAVEPRLKLHREFTRQYKDINDGELRITRSIVYDLKGRYEQDQAALERRVLKLEGFLVRLGGMLDAQAQSTKEPD